MLVQLHLFDDLDCLKLFGLKFIAVEEAFYKIGNFVPYYNDV